MKKIKGYLLCTLYFVLALITLTTVIWLFTHEGSVLATNDDYLYMLIKALLIGASAAITLFFLVKAILKLEGLMDN